MMDPDGQLQNVSSQLFNDNFCSRHSSFAAIVDTDGLLGGEERNLLPNYQLCFQPVGHKV